jgi:hypothetical protein
MANLRTDAPTGNRAYSRSLASHPLQILAALPAALAVVLRGFPQSVYMKWYWKVPGLG